MCYNVHMTSIITENKTHLHRWIIRGLEASILWVCSNKQQGLLVIRMLLPPSKKVLSNNLTNDVMHLFLYTKLHNKGPLLKQEKLIVLIYFFNCVVTA